jgi:hypothetical protein
MESADVPIPPAAQPGASEPPTPALPSQPPPPPSPPPLAAAPIQSSAVSGGDQCASCGTLLAVDQRYCLQCGQRRGDPRLPFMDAVVLMEAVRQPRQAPPPPPKKKRRDGISPNAALITGIGVLLLALGIGVLIGRSGHSTVASAPQTPQVITVGGGAGGEEKATASKAKTTTGGSGKVPKSKKEKAQALKESEKHPAAEEVLKPAGNVKLPPPKIQPGGKCENGAAGCKHGEFTGEFFGE